VVSLAQAARFPWSKPVGLTGKCYEWVDEYLSNQQAGKLITELRQKGIIGKYIQVDQQVWFNKIFRTILGPLGADVGHTAIRITLSNGVVFYLDDGNKGGVDHVFMDSEVPWYYSAAFGPPAGFKIDPR
jgi:hypothetical protein